MLPGLGLSSRYLHLLGRHLPVTSGVWIVDCQGPIARGGGATFKVVEVARAVCEWAPWRNIKSATVVGHSYGAQVAVELALWKPDLVNTLVLAAPPIDPAGRRISRLVFRLLRDTLHEPVSLILMAASCYLKNGVRAWKMLREALKEPLEQRVAGLQQPVLLIRGAKDTVVPHSWTVQLSRLIGDSSLLTIPRHAHGVVFSNAQTVADAIRQFAPPGAMEMPEWSSRTQLTIL
ncbi:MAG TPA: alpha/beta hydrolase [Verrucomicrobiales bacterium]|nr:alpha/beta hydrolase [Verrucomicrobiales bacterium]